MAVRSSAAASANPRNFGVKRIMKEYAEFERDEDTNEYFTAKPCEDNLFEWHFTIRGPPDSDFQGGRYHGRILLPSEYPFKPPDIVMLTPSGRFETNKKICLSISSFHPKNWQPSWSIRTVLTALIAFFPTPGHGAIGSLDYSSHERKEYAARSGAFTCQLCARTNLELLPERAAGAAGGAGAVPQLPKEVTDTIDSNKSIPALPGSQPATPAHAGAAHAAHGPPTPLNLIQAQRIADAPSNVTSPTLARTHSEPVQHPPGQSDPVGLGSMLPPPTDALAGAAVLTPAASPAVAAAATPATPRVSVPLVLDEGLRQRQGRVVMPTGPQAQNGAPGAAAMAAPAAAAVPAAAAAPPAAAAAVAVAAPRAAPLSSVTVFITFAILLILMRKLYASVNRQPAFGGFDYGQE